eukprot:Amastigsp_a842473_46.p4 type:complete len:192 gc:universal Amastigsp_a842473_46:613-38(-)
MPHAQGACVDASKFPMVLAGLEELGLALVADFKHQHDDRRSMREPQQRLDKRPEACAFVDELARENEIRAKPLGRSQSGGTPGKFEHASGRPQQRRIPLEVGSQKRSHWRYIREYDLFGGLKGAQQPRGPCPCAQVDNGLASPAPRRPAALQLQILNEHDSPIPNCCSCVSFARALLNHQCCAVRFNLSFE